MDKYYLLITLEMLDRFLSFFFIVRQLNLSCMTSYMWLWGVVGYGLSLVILRLLACVPLVAKSWQLAELSQERVIRGLHLWPPFHPTQANKLGTRQKVIFYSD